jgi:hypothetical protein
LPLFTELPRRDVPGNLELPEMGVPGNSRDMKTSRGLTAPALLALALFVYPTLKPKAL